MDLAPTLFSTSWSSGVNAYATVALLNVLGRLGWGDVPEELQGNAILAVAVVMYVVEFVADKVPFFDSIWDAINLPVRTAVAGAIGAVYGSADDLQGTEQAFAAGGSSATALASAGVKSLLRLGINTSPEPASNIIASLLEDGAVGVVVFIAVEHPVPAAADRRHPARLRDRARRLPREADPPRLPRAAPPLRARPAPERPASAADLDSRDEQRDEHDLDAEPDPGVAALGRFDGSRDQSSCGHAGRRDCGARSARPRAPRRSRRSRPRRARRRARSGSRRRSRGSRCGRRAEAPQRRSPPAPARAARGRPRPARRRTRRPRTPRRQPSRVNVR